MATRYSIPAWKSPWMGEPGGQQSMGSQGVRHNWATEHTHPHTHTRLLRHLLLSNSWDGWMASPTLWTWVWAGSGSWWRTGKPGMLQSMCSQIVRHDWVTELNWTELSNPLKLTVSLFICFDQNKWFRFIPQKWWESAHHLWTHTEWSSF